MLVGLFDMRATQRSFLIGVRIVLRVRITPHQTATVFDGVDDHDGG